MRSATEMRLRPCLRAKASICAPTMTVPSSLASSQMTATGGSPASLQRSTAASVWPGAHQHAAVPGDQRKDVAGADEVGRAHVAVGERPHGVGALLGRDAGGQPVPHVDRDREGGAERRVVGGHHGGELQPARLVAVIGVQTMPQQLRMMKAIISGVQCEAAQTRSPSFSRSSSSVTTTILPCAERLDGFDHGLMCWHRQWSRSRARRGSRWASPPRRVARRMVSAVSRDTQAFGWLQICVTAPGDRPMLRAKSPRLMPVCVSQSASFMLAA